MNKILPTLAALLIAGSAIASSVTPTYTSFGNLAGATWGGSGIPTDPTAISVINYGSDTITLGLIATPRYSNPTLGNNGAGMYFATPGLNNGLVSPPKSLAATWNFGFYIGNSAGITAGYTYALSYGSDASSLFSFNPLSISDNQVSSTTVQNSENLAFGFGIPISFDANANADYSFVLSAYDQAGAKVGSSAMVVRVGTGGAVPDAGSTCMLLGTGLVGLAGLRRKLGV